MSQAHWRLTGVLGALALSGVGILAQKVPDSTRVEAPIVIRAESVGHVVESLEKTIPFYRDVLRLELIDVDAAPVASAALQQLTNVPGARLRTAHFKVPNTPTTFELREFTGVDRTSREANLGNPGTMWLTWSVNDEAAAVEALKKAQPRLITERGYPVNPRIGTLSTVFLRDPDGTVTEVVHRPPGDFFTVPPPPGAWQSGSNLVVSLQWATSLDGEQAMGFYHDLLGFDIRPMRSRTINELFATSTSFPEGGGWNVNGRGRGGNTTGAPTTGRSRMPTGSCAAVMCEFMDQSTDPPLPPLGARIQDPGAGFLSVWVSDLNALLGRMQTAGVRIVSSEGKPVRVGNSMRVLVSDPGGFYVELMQRTR